MKIASLVSGGVDSSVSLSLMAQSGASVTPFYIKIWMEDDFGACPWDEDLTFVRQAAKKYGLDLQIISLQKEYWDTIVEYLLAEVKKGRTPNPDVLCNNLIKFGVFYDQYGRQFDEIATGHYARTKFVGKQKQLLKAIDPAKDQAYFLSRLSIQQLNKCVFPIGDLPKEKVRQMAKDFGLLTYNRPDSQGLCFLGKINFRDFIKKYVGEKEGQIVEANTGKILRNHHGHWFYTIGQREGLQIGGSDKPYYVSGKDADDNIVFVAKGQDNPLLWKQNVELEDFQLLTTDKIDWEKKYSIQLRYHSEYVTGTLVRKQGIVAVGLDKPVFGVASGQFGVIFDGELVIGSGIIK